MNKIKELFDYVDKLNKKSKYYILTYGEVISYNDEEYQWDEGSRAQSPYELMADYVNNEEAPTIEGFVEWSKSQKVSVIHKKYNAYVEPEGAWDKYDPFEQMTLHEALSNE